MSAEPLILSHECFFLNFGHQHRELQKVLQENKILARELVTVSPLNDIILCISILLVN
jgi:hypothetical protein